MKKMNRKGFTIVELVIVIAVIAILAGVLIPTFSGIVEKANNSAVLQAARNTYTEYTALNDYAKGEPAKNLIIMVKIGEFDTSTKAETGKGEYIVVKDGKIGTKVIDTLAKAISELGDFDYDAENTAKLDASLKKKVFLVKAGTATETFVSETMADCVVHPGK